MNNFLIYIKSLFSENPKKITILGALLFTLDFMRGYGVEISDMTRSDVYTWGVIDMFITFVAGVLMYSLFLSLVKRQASYFFVKASFWAVLSSSVKSFLSGFLVFLLFITVVGTLLQNVDIVGILNSPKVSYASYIVILVVMVLLYPIYTIMGVCFSKLLVARQVKRIAARKQIKAKLLPGMTGWFGAVLVAIKSIFIPKGVQLILFAYLVVDALHVPLAHYGYTLSSSIMYTLSCGLMLLYFLKGHYDEQERVAKQIKETLQP